MDVQNTLIAHNSHAFPDGASILSIEGNMEHPLEKKVNIL